MIDFQTPLAGIAQASQALDRAATRIAAASTPAEDSVDLSAAIVALLEAKNSYSANLKVAQTYDELSRTLIDVLA